MKKCFTLVELLVAIAIMAVLVMAVLPFVTNYTRWSRQISNNRSARLIYDAINRYNTLTSGPLITGAGGIGANSTYLRGALEGNGPYAINVKLGTLNWPVQPGFVGDRFVVLPSNIILH